VTEPSDRPAGRWTPAELSVHQSIGGGPLPAYVCRPHDERLRAVLDPACEYSRLVVIRGDALTGTSRTVYEAVTGLFGLFLEARPEEAGTYRFGREPDGTPSPPWTWSEPEGVSGLPD
jgi:hypothetical protein